METERLEREAKEAEEDKVKYNNDIRDIRSIR